MQVVQTYTYHVQSNQRQSGTDTDLTIQLPLIISKIAKNSKLAVTVHDITVPFSFFQLSSDIAQIQCVFTDSTGQSKTTIVTLQVGNYNAINVLAELSSKLTAAAQISSGSYTGYTPGYTFSYSQVTGRASFVQTVGGSSSTRVNFSTNTLLGLFFGRSTDLIITSSPDYSTKTICTNPVNNLFLRCSTLQQMKNREWIVEKGVFSDIVYKCPIFSQQMTYISSNHAGERILVQNDNVSDLNFYLTTNLSYTPIDLQGLDIGFSFSFTIEELVMQEYAPITDDLLTNTKNAIPPQPTISAEDLQLLEAERERQLSKLSKYKDRLEKKIIKNGSKIKTNDTTDEPILQQEERSTGVLGKPASSESQ